MRRFALQQPLMHMPDRAQGLPDIVENHLPVNGNFIAISAREVDRGQATIAEPSDDARLAFYGQRLTQTG
jgi:hypothetical protein